MYFLFFVLSLELSAQTHTDDAAYFGVDCFLRQIIQPGIGTEQRKVLFTFQWIKIKTLPTAKKIACYSRQVKVTTIKIDIGENDLQKLTNVEH